MEKKSHVISILVPIYNVELYIERCVRSLFEQTFVDIEYIFVDDCSPDKSVDVLKCVMKDYPERIHDVKILTHDKNKGLSAARNTALDNASGDYVLFVDSDDYLRKDAIFLLYNKIRECSTDIVWCDINVAYKHKLKTDVVVLPETIEEYRKLVLMRQVHLSVCGKLFKRNLFDSIRFVEGVTFAEDYATLPRIAYRAHSISKVEAPLYYYVKYNETSCTAKMKQKNLDDALVVRNKLMEFFTSIPDAIDYAETLAQAMLYFKLHMVKSCWQSQEFIRQIATSWGNTGDTCVNILPLKDRIIMYLLKHRQYCLLGIVFRVGHRLRLN